MVLKAGDKIKILKCHGWQGEQKYGIEIGKVYKIKGNSMFSLTTKKHPTNIYFYEKDFEYKKIKPSLKEWLKER